MQLQMPAQPAVLAGGGCASLSASGQKSPLGTWEAHTFLQEFSGFDDGTYPGEECFLGKKALPKCPDYIVN